MIKNCKIVKLDQIIWSPISLSSFGRKKYKSPEHSIVKLDVSLNGFFIYLYTAAEYFRKCLTSSSACSKVSTYP